MRYRPSNFTTFCNFDEYFYETLARLDVKELVRVFNWFGLGKKRSALGEFMDGEDISQTWLAEESGINKSTISRICSEDDYEPRMKTAKKILKALRKEGYDVDYGDFWDI